MLRMCLGENMKFEMSRFIKSICSLLLSQVLIKIFGMFYTLYLTNKVGFGDKGNAIYMSGYQIYSLMLTVSSIGIPNAIAKLIAEKEVLRDFKNSKRILYTASIVFGFIGFCGAICLYVFAEEIAINLVGIQEGILSIKVLAPAVFFVSVSAVMRGYFNGKNNFKVGAQAQVLEQVLKSTFTILFVESLSKISLNDTKIMAAGANLATTISTIISFLYIVKIYYIEEKIVLKPFNTFRLESYFLIIKRIMLISFPITFSVLLGTLTKNVDSITIIRILKEIMGEEAAIIKYGILSSKVDILIAMPLALNSSIAAAIVPEISALSVLDKKEFFKSKIIEALDLTSLILIPCVFGMIVYAKEIFIILFPNAYKGYELLSMGAISLIFLGYVQTINGILQGIDKSFETLIVAIISIFIKVICNVCLIRIEGIYEKGAVIGNVISSFISFMIVKEFLIKTVDFKVSFYKISSKYIVVSLVMIILSKILYCILESFGLNLYLTIVFSIIFSVIIYVFLIFLIKILKKIRKKPKSKTQCFQWFWDCQNRKVLKNK